MTSVTTDTSLTHDVADYNFLLNIQENQIPPSATGSLFIEWPGNYSE